MAVAGVAFLVVRIQGYAAEINLAHFFPPHWLVLFALALLYGGANVALARAWWLILRFLGNFIGWRPALRVYGLSQIAKYVPGNVFQFASRQALGSLTGVNGKDLAKSSFWEVVLLLLAGALFTALAAPLFIEILPNMAGLLLFAVMLSLSLFLLRKFASPLLARAAAWQVLFLLTSGAVFAATLLLVRTQPVELDLLPAICGAFVLAWLAGFATPGAPAGLGVREVVLLFFLGQYLLEIDLLLAVVLGRIVTVAGDLLFMVSVGISKKA